MGMHCKAGTTELTREEAEEIFNAKLYVVNHTAIWQPHFSEEKNKYYFTKVASVKGIARKGSFYRMTAKRINEVLGENLLNED